MPELPDITVYVEALESRILGATLRRVRMASPFLLRTASPAVADAEGHTVTGIRRVGKRIAIGVDNDIFLVLHLMIAGRLHWSKPGAKIPGGRRGLAAFDFESGTLILTEAGTQKRASLHMAMGTEGLAALDPGGIDVMAASTREFADHLTATNHTLKRALTDPRTFSGIGNAYSDEILHRARLSPIAMTQKLTAAEIDRLHAAIRDTLADWIERLRRDAGGDFPEHVTAFRDGMAAHGRYGQPCPVCQTAIQRIRYANNETNYCPACQTGGRLLADRALSRLLGKDWPRTLEELESLPARGAPAGGAVS
ncbi:MAG: DNA-formamidopyrimidine glycosylase family protein [Bryobacteraceae bacterium]